MPGDFGGPVCSCAFSLVGLAHGTAGAPCTWHSRAPFVLGCVKIMANLEQCLLRDRGPVSRSDSHVSTSLRAHRARIRATRWLAMTLLDSWDSNGASHSQSSSPAHAGDPVFQRRQRRTDKPRRTGSPHARG